MSKPTAYPYKVNVFEEQQVYFGHGIDARQEKPDELEVYQGYLILHDGRKVMMHNIEYEFIKNIAFLDMMKAVERNNFVLAHPECFRGPIVRKAD